MKSQFSNPYKVGEFTRENAIRMYEQFLDCSPELNRQVQSLSGKRLVCHCSKAQLCHASYESLSSYAQMLLTEMPRHRELRRLAN